MFSYIFITYLLSTIGGLFYWFFIRNRMDARYQKNILLTIIACSFFVPLFVDQLPAQEDKPCLHQHTIPAYVYTEYCPDEGELQMCYELALKEEHFCECEVIAMENILKYEPNSMYDWWIEKRSSFNKFAIFIITGISFLLFCKLLYLLVLIVVSKKEKAILHTYQYTILHPPKYLSIGSFQLLKPYIIWQKEMDTLTKEEQEAILWHEISHLQQKDTWLKIVLHLIQTVWLANPVFYWLKQELARLSEYIADDFAIGQTGNLTFYASLLVKMKRYKNVVLVNHFKNNDFKNRITYLLAERQTPKKLWMIVCMSCMFSLFSMSTYYVIPFVGKQTDKLRIYERLADESKVSGKSLFCRHCLLIE